MTTIAHPFAHSKPQPINSDARMLDAALFYAKRLGWAVFPVHVPIHNDAGECIGCTCEHYQRSEANRQWLIALGRGHQFDPGYKCPQPGKCPVVRWRDKSTTDEAQIRKWWGAPWRAGAVSFLPNIGLDCGKSGILTLDADAYKESYAGADLLSWNDRQTVTALTGGGGEHLIYAAQGAPFGNDTKGIPAGIDIRGAGGYIVAAPSLHRAGQRYQWEADYGPHETELLPIPTGLRDILEAAHQVKLARQAQAYAITFGTVSSEAPDLAQWRLSETTLDMIQTPADRGHRSEQDAHVVTALCGAGASDDEILAIFEHYPIGTAGKYSERGLDYLARTITNCRSYLAEKEQERRRFLAMLEYLLTWILETCFANIWPELRTRRRFKAGAGYVERMVYPCDSRDTKAAFYVVRKMLEHKTDTVYIGKREAADATGLGADTFLRALDQLHGRLFNITKEPGKVTVVTLNLEFVSRGCAINYPLLQDQDTTVNELAHPRETKIYAERMNTDPYLTGTSHHQKKDADKAVAVAGGTRADWLALMPKGFGEIVLRIHTLGLDGTSDEIAEAIGRPRSSVWRALSYVESLGGVESTREGPRAKKVYSLVPHFDEWVEEITPQLRTYKLADERKARHLKEAQRWAKLEEEKAKAAGDQETVQKAQRRQRRLGNERAKVLERIYPEMDPMDRATLAHDVQIPQAPHPALIAKMKRQHELARADVASMRRREQWDLTREVQRLREDGASKHDAARQLQIAGYAPTETWAAIDRVWPKAQEVAYA